VDGRKLTIWAAAAALWLLPAVPAKAATILINSGAGLAYSNLNSSGQYNGIGPSGLTVAIGAHPLWQPNNPNGSSAVWISYAQTGYEGNHFQPSLGSTPVVTITDTFTATENNVLNLQVWADDSAGVYVDGVQVFAPVYTQGSACSGQVIGCLPGQAGVLSNYHLGPGTHTITFDLFQTGTGTDTTSNPMGLLFTGSDIAAPEPAALLLVGGGLVGIGLLRRRSKAVSARS
jgi:hypothetical protein